MGPKKGRGTKIDLASYAAATEDNLEWAKDEFAPTPPTGPAAPGEEPPTIDGKKDWRNFGFKAGKMDGNFRDEAPVQLTTVVPHDMQAPFVAYVGNLPHNIAPSVVEEEFAEVVSVRVIKHERSTFAYVEFESREALQTAIYLTGKVVGGRKIKVDVASDAQRERLEKETRGASPNGESFGRDGMGTAQPRRGGMGSRNGSAMDLAFSRDTMGAAQPSADRLGTPTSTGSPPELSRDVFGGAQPVKSPLSGGRGMNFRDRSKPASPITGGAPNFREGPAVSAPPADFGGWRNSDKVEQPPAPAPAAVASPTTTGAPTFARRGEAIEKKDTKPVEEAKKVEPEAKKAASSENSWRRGPPPAAAAGDRFGALRQ